MDKAKRRKTTIMVKQKLLDKLKLKNLSSKHFANSKIKKTLRKRKRRTLTARGKKKRSNA